MQSLKKCANLSCRVSKNVQPLVQSLKKCANLSSRVSKNVLTFRAESLAGDWSGGVCVTSLLSATVPFTHLTASQSTQRGLGHTGADGFWLIPIPPPPPPPPPPHLLLVCRDIGGLGGYIIHMMEKYSLYHYRTSYLLHVFGRIKSSETKFKTAY